LTRPRPFPADPERVSLSRWDWLGLVACAVGVAASVLTGAWTVGAALLALENRVSTMEQIEREGQRRDDLQDNRLDGHDAALMRVGRVTP
jgi:hypothetical protein